MGDQQGDFPDYLPVTEEFLTALAEKYPNWTTLTKRIGSKLPNFLEMLHSIPVIGVGMDLNVILQSHHLLVLGENDEEEDVPEAAMSQQKIAELLRNERPQVLGLEGFWTRATRSNLIKYLKFRGYTSAEARLETVKLEIRDAGAAYAFKHSKTLAVGYEDKDLLFLHGNFWKIPGLGGSEAETYVRFLRSIIAVAYTLLEAKKLGASKCYLIIGAAHGFEIAALMRNAGLHGQIIDCR